MKRYVSVISNILMTVALMGLTAYAALTHTRPFHLVEHGTLTVDQDGNLVSDGTGTATHLGSFTLHRTAKLKPSEDGSGLVDVDGRATLIAANGDQLEASIEGTLNPQTHHAVLAYEWKGGTGRFKNATGTAIWLVDITDNTYDVVADGVINY
jgi:hypothetical protein